MPKEMIDSGSAYRVKVGWAHHEEVQVGVVVNSLNSDTLLTQLLGEDSALEWIGRNVVLLASTTGLAGDTPADQRALGIRLVKELDAYLAPFNTGVESRLDRAGVNHLIRILRRARDQAFGKDE